MCAFKNGECFVFMTQEGGAGQGKGVQLWYCVQGEWTPQASDWGKFFFVCIHVKRVSVAVVHSVLNLGSYVRNMSRQTLRHTRWHFLCSQIYWSKFSHESFCFDALFKRSIGERLRSSTTLKLKFCILDWFCPVIRLYTCMKRLVCT